MRRAKPSIEDLRKEPGRDSLTFIPGTWGHGKWNVIVRSRLPGQGMSKIPNTGKWFDIKGPIAKAIGIKDLNLHVLRWSDRNSVADRREAANELKSHLAECLESAPDTKHFIIAHSHGGNIAATAFAQMEQTTSLKRLHFAAMSTPFIWFHIRGLSIPVRNSMLLLLAIAIFALLGLAAVAWSLVVFLIPNSLPERLPILSEHMWFIVVRIIQWTVSIVVFLLCCTLLGQVLMRVEKWIPSELAQSEKQSLMKIRSALGSVIILQPPADEAWLGLAIPAIGMWLNRGVGLIISKAWTLVAYSFVTGLSGIGIFMLFDVILHRLGPQFEPPEPIMYPIALAAMIAGCLALAAPAQGVIYAVLALLGGITLRFLGYGLAEGIALTLSTEVHVEHYPAGGPWDLYCPSERLEGLHHAIYESLEVQQWLAHWVKDKLT